MNDGQDRKDGQGQAGWTPPERRLPRKLPSARQLNQKLWLGVICAVDLLDHPDPAVKLKAVHSLSAVAGQYLKGLEVGEIQKRLRDIEGALKIQQEDGQE